MEGGIANNTMQGKNAALYGLVNATRDKELTAGGIDDFIAVSDVDKETGARLAAWKNELRFWEEYSDIYFNLEKAYSYRTLTGSIRKLIDARAGETWLDAGCGPLRTSELIYEVSGRQVKSIEAIDIVLKPARAKIEALRRRGTVLPVNLKYASLGDTLPYPDGCFDGIGANLVLSYVHDFMGKKGRDALKGVLAEMYRILKPGGRLIWSTPKQNVNFNWVFLASIPDMLNVYEYIANKDISRIMQGTSILKHALTIQKKGKEGFYTFLPCDELEKLMTEIGFVNPVCEKSFAQQVLVYRVCKPINVPRGEVACRNKHIYDIRLSMLF